MDIEQAKTFLAENHRGVLATYRQSGALQMSPILIGVDDEGRAIISSRETAYKVQVCRSSSSSSGITIDSDWWKKFIELLKPFQLDPHILEGLSLATNNLLMKEVQDEARVKVILEKIQIFDDRDLFGKGEFRFSTRVHSRNFGGQYNEFEIPAEGYLSVSDKEGRNTIDLNVEIFEGHLIDHLAIEITGAEYDTKKLKDDLTPYRRIFQGPVKHWLGSIGPSNEQIEPEILGSWAIWYRIEEI